MSLRDTRKTLLGLIRASCSKEEIWLNMFHKDLKEPGEHHDLTFAQQLRHRAARALSPSLMVHVQLKRDMDVPTLMSAKTGCCCFFFFFLLFLTQN